MLKFFIDGFKINAIFTLFSRLTGFIRDIFFAYFLGAGIHSDIFFIASKIPNLFRRITAEGAFTSSFLPVYSGLLSGKNRKIAEEFSKLIFVILLILITILTIILEIFMNELILLIAPGFQENQELLNQIITLSRFTILFLPIISIVALFGAMLNASGKFAPFAFTPIILNVCLVIACIFIAKNMTIKSFPLAIALPVSGIIQLLFILFFSFKYKLISKDFFNFLKLKKQNLLKFSKLLNVTMKRFFPAMLSGGIFQINILVDTLLASFLGVGAISFLYYADRLVQLPLGVIGVALGTALISSLSRPTILKNKTKTAIQFEQSLKICIFFSIPAMLALLFFPEIIVNSLFKRGNFGSYESEQTTFALICYSLGIPFLIMTKSCQAVFLASGKTYRIMLISLFQLIANIILSLILMKHLFHGGIALATSISTFLGCVFYFKLIYNDKKIRVGKLTLNNDFGLVYLIKYIFVILFISLMMIIFLDFLIFLFDFINLEINLFYVFLFALLGICFFTFITYITKQIPVELFNNIK